MATTVFDPSEDRSDAEKAAEAAALEQGEKIAQMQAEDKARRYAEAEASNEDPELIGGKFKSQDELLKAYEELQKKMSSGETTEEESADEEAPAEPSAEEEVEEVSDAESALSRASEAYAKDGKLDEASIEELSKMDSKELIQAYVQYYSKNQAAQQQQAVDSKSIYDSVGGEEAYTEMIGWAANNLSPEEIASYNEVTSSGNTAAVKFAVEALSNRYKASEGSEAPLVTGRKAAPSKDRFRSHAELSRAIADPRYQSDPAYRMDVEAKLSRSTDLL